MTQEKKPGETLDPPAPRRPKTGPGQMMAFREEMIKYEDRIAELEAELADARQTKPCGWFIIRDHNFLTVKIQTALISDGQATRLRDAVENILEEGTEKE